MRLFLFLTVVFFTTYSFGFSQESQRTKHIEKIDIGKEKRNLTIDYTLKQGKENNSVLEVKFFNKTRAHLNVDLVIGFYSNGILLEKATIADCLKKSFLSNFFRPYHLVETPIKEVQEVEILNFKSEQVDECRQTH